MPYIPHVPGEPWENPFTGDVYRSEQEYRHNMISESSEDMFKECARLGADYAPEVLDFGGKGSHDVQRMDPVAFNPGKLAGRVYARAALAREYYTPHIADRYARMQSALSSLKSAPAAYSGNADKGNMRWGNYMPDVQMPHVQMPDFSTFNVMGAFSDPYATAHSKYAEYDVTVPRRPQHHLQRDNYAKRFGYDA